MDIPIASQNVHLPGYGMFWMANSISSTLLGLKNRKVQDEAYERSEAFQLEMERARNLTDDQKRQEEIAFRRRMLEVSRQYRQEESSATFLSKMKVDELKKFLERCWPLEIQLARVFLKKTEKEKSLTHPYLNVILMHTPLLPQKKYGGANEQDKDLYESLEYAITQKDIPLIGNVHFWKDACCKPDFQGGNASIMNIHFLMSQLPTLVIVPHYLNGHIGFKGAVWEPQSARPLIRPLFSIDYSPEKALTDNEYRKGAMVTFRAAVSVITGSVRDSYLLLTQGKKPSLPSLLNDSEHEQMKSIAASHEGIRKFIKQENENILASLNECATPHLLEVYSHEDINDIKKQIQSTF